MYQHPAKTPSFGENDVTLPSVEYRIIPLTKGQVARVGINDYERIVVSKWYAYWCKFTQSYYARRNSKYIRGQKRFTILMHREILGLLPGDPREGDHENLDTLDNTPKNLRIAPDGFNRRNTRKRRTNTSGYKGVTLHRPTGRWKAQIVVNGGKIYLGLFDTKEEAYAAYCVAAIKYHGEFARLE